MSLPTHCAAVAQQLVTKNVCEQYGALCRDMIAKFTKTLQLERHGCMCAVFATCEMQPISTYAHAHGFPCIGV